nr:immunoglobulin heavy chain junction region [Macaca mulatta]MOV55485.1 immunoglobulin heavy chain junction region [Macaca mulatta]MOV55525.1 immunoglobulin heavy chain junction region [Macaca mulatta]MOV55719.1 immunoglobulin heavy chain junction region [Macaca mulatta]MOV55732.1 immunoglobulin heavy chain junction region [Macaca mulatta]
CVKEWNHDYGSNW